MVVVIIGKDIDLLLILLLLSVMAQEEHKNVFLLKPAQGEQDARLYNGKSISKSKMNLADLPPTKAAAQQHALRVYHQPPKELLNLLNNNTSDFSKPFNDACSTFTTEDCLYLSLFVPLKNYAESFPVMVWLHEHSNSHDPDFLIDEDVIVVRVSYRIGVLGFLNTDDDFAQGNMGAKDVLTALRWIRHNVAHFNGDPNRVTVFGSGLSAAIVASLLLCPAADDLAARVVIQSGSALSPADYRSYNFEIANKLYWRLGGSFDKFDRKELYEKLSTAATKKLVSVSRNIFDSSEVRDAQRFISSFGPSVEMSNKNYFMKTTPLEVYNRRTTNNNVEVMMGYTTLESLHKLSGLVENRELLPYFNYNFQYLLPFEGKPHPYGSKTYRDIRKKIMDFYFLNGTITTRSLKRYAKYVSDQVIYPLLRQARLHDETSCSNVYVYRFSFNGSFNIGWHSSLRNLTKISGATLGDEICYLFRCKSVDELYRSSEVTPEGYFIKKITRLWANFAKFGNPTPMSQDQILGDFEWEPLKRDHLNVLNLGRKIKMVFAPEIKRVTFWDNLREEYFYPKSLHNEL